ncbi:hypothetical protein D3C73_1625020 [compost metagenome]
MREFYGLEVLDMSMIKAVSVDDSVLTAHMNLVGVYQIETTNGVFHTDTSILKEIIKTSASEGYK